MASTKPTILVNKTVVSKDGKRYDIPQVVVHMDALEPEKVEISIKPAKKGAATTTAKTAAPAKPYFQIRYPHTDGRMYDLLIRFKGAKDVIRINNLESYPPTEEDPLKQQHSVKIGSICDDYLAKLDAIHEKILDFVEANQKEILGNKVNKKREIIEEITKSVVKRDMDAEGNPYPPKMRGKVKIDPMTGAPKMEMYRKEGNQLNPVELTSIENLVAEMNTSYERVATIEPSFYVMGTQCGWTLTLHSLLLGEKNARQAVERPAYTADDLDEVSGGVANVAVNDTHVETVETTEDDAPAEPETAVVESSGEEEEVNDEDGDDLDLPPPPVVNTKPKAAAAEPTIAAPKTRRGVAARK